MVPLFTIPISLERPESRRSIAVEALSQLSYLDWDIFEGIDGLQLQNTPPEYREAKVNRLLGFPLAPSEIGCFLSHHQASREVSIEHSTGFSIATLGFQSKYLTAY